MTSSTLLFIVLALLMTAIAIGMVLRPLLASTAGQDTAVQAQAEAALQVLREQLRDLRCDYHSGTISEARWREGEEELERRALDEGLEGADVAVTRRETHWAWSIGLLMAVVATTGYLALGEPMAVDARNTQVPQSTNDAGGLSDTINVLADRLQQESGTPQEWSMLARSYTVLGDYAKAVDAYIHLEAMLPDDPDVLAGHAEVLTLQHGMVTAQAESLVHKALALEPRHATALLIAGTAAFQRKEFAVAASHWEAVLAMQDTDDPDARPLREAIADAKAKAGP